MFFYAAGPHFVDIGDGAHYWNLLGLELLLQPKLEKEMKIESEKTIPPGPAPFHSVVCRTLAPRGVEAARKFPKRIQLRSPPIPNPALRLQKNSR